MGNCTWNKWLRCVRGMSAIWWSCMLVLSWCLISVFAGGRGELSQLLPPWSIKQKGSIWLQYDSEICFIVRFNIAQLLVVQLIKGRTALRTLCYIAECLSVFMYVRMRWRMGDGWKREWTSFNHISETTCTTMSERVVRKEMGALFCTIPWYSSNEVSLRVHYYVEPVGQKYGA